MNFDSIIDRRGTGSIKWDRRPELDPYWVADMDFQSPPAVIEAVKKAAELGIFGYANAHEGLVESVLQYLEKRHGVTMQEKHILHLGGLVMALSLTMRAFGKPGDKALTCTPVYAPFLTVAADAGMETSAVDHIEKDGKWTFDFDKMTEQIEAERSNSFVSDTKVFILCNPQNPLGRSFSKEEITKVAQFCHKYDLVLIADEIHCDLVYNEDEQPFFSALNLPYELRQKLIVLQAPSKTYNIAGMGYAFAIIENDELRAQYNKAKGQTLPEINCISFYTAEAAYKHGEEWRQELLKYLKKNRDTVTDFVRSEMPEIKIPNIEATYLAWMDCSLLEYNNPSLILEKQQQLFVSNGASFGKPQGIRFNFGCSHSRVLEGLEKIKKGLYYLSN